MVNTKHHKNIPDDPITTSTTFTFFVGGSYAITSLLIVFLNRLLFTKVFQWPIFITWFQQCIGTLIYWSLYIFPRTQLCPFKLKTITISKSTISTHIPVSLSFVGMVLCSNIALKYALISTYQTARCLTIFWTILFSKLLLNESFSYFILSACAIQAIGFFIGSMDITTLVPLGSLFGALSSFCQGIYNVSIKRALQKTKDKTIHSIGINLTASNIILFPIIFLFGESSSFYELPFDTNDEKFWPIWTSLFASGIFATLLNYVTYLVIESTSPVTFNIIGVGKSCVQTMIGIIMGDPTTIRSLTGIILTIFGSAWYGSLKVNELKLKANCPISDSPNETDLLINPLENHSMEIDYNRKQI